MLVFAKAKKTGKTTVDNMVKGWSPRELSLPLLQEPREASSFINANLFSSHVVRWEGHS